MSHRQLMHTCAFLTVLLLTLFVASGCNRHAKVWTANGIKPVVLESGDAEHVYGEHGEVIRRDEIVDVSHPGNVGMAVYGGMTLLGAVWLSWMAYLVADSGSSGIGGLGAVLFLGPPSVLTGAGLGGLIFYIVQYTRSTQALGELDGVAVLPTATVNADGDARGGLALRVEW